MKQVKKPTAKRMGSIAAAMLMATFIAPAVGATAAPMDHGGFTILSIDYDDMLYSTAGMDPPTIELGPRTITCEGINVELTQEFIDISVSNSALIAADPWGIDYSALPTYGDGWLRVMDTSTWEPATLQSQDRNLSLLRVLSDGTTMPVICNGGGVV